MTNLLRRPHLEDFRTIGYYTGVVLNGLSLMMVVPLLSSLLFREWAVAVDFVIAMAVGFMVGYGLILISNPRRLDLNWVHGMVVASFSWLLGTMVGALPYWLSLHYRSYLDACFDVMSGFTTTGLVLVQDLDHVSVGINMWRHLLTYLGGQGMVVLALTFLVQDAAGAFKMYVGEAKDERLLPNVVHTARTIWFISLTYLAVGTALQWLAGMAIGVAPVRALLQGLWIFMSGWSTGGFAPMSQGIIYYHSALYETVTVLFFVAGSLNFALHYAIWSGKRDEIYRNVETVTFALTSTLLGAVAVAGLAHTGTYANLAALLRKGYYILISGHTTTGFQPIYARQFVHEWGDLALLALITAMLFGGSAVSTAGGFKALRLGIISKALVQEIRRLLAPESAVVVEKFHYMREVVLEDSSVRNALLIVVLYLGTWGLGSVVGVISGFPFRDAIFESASVTGNVGLSIGVTSPAMPALLKVTYIVMMWAGRMEFMSVLALIGFVWAGVRGR